MTVRRRWHILVDLIKQNDWTFGVELGVGNGQNLDYIAKHTGCEMWGFDLWSPLAGLPDYDHVANRRAAFQVAAEHHPQVKLFPLRTTMSAEVVFKNHTQRPDFVFIDGDHSYRGCLADIETWADHDVVIIGHDWNKDGVQRACRKALPGVQPLEFDGCWIWS